MFVSYFLISFSFGLFDRELICSVAVILLAWLENSLNPVLLVWRIRELLAFKTYAYILWVLTTLVSDVWLIADALEVTSIALNTWLVSEHLHKNTSLWRVERSTNLSIVALTVLECVKAEVVVDTTVSVLDLVEINLTYCIAESVCGVVKSNGVSLTGLISPVGM